MHKVEDAEHFVTPELKTVPQHLANARRILFMGRKGQRKIPGNSRRRNNIDLCWPIVYDAGPTLNQGFLGYPPSATDPPSL